MKHYYDKKADAVYIELSEKPYAVTKELDEVRYLDLASDSTVIGIELLCVSDGVTIDDLPERQKVEKILDKYGIKVCV